MTKREGAIISAFTGIMVANSFSDVQEYADELFGYPTFTHQFGDKGFAEEFKEKSKADFMNLCATQV
jgi:hypothetical protein